MARNVFVPFVRAEVCVAVWLNAVDHDARYRLELPPPVFSYATTKSVARHAQALIDELSRKSRTRK